jgi:hypothetical protein
MASKKTSTRQSKKIKTFLLEQDLLQPLYQARPNGLPPSKLPKGECLATALNSGLVEKKMKGKSGLFLLTVAGEKRLWQWWPVEKKIEEMGKRQKALDDCLVELICRCQGMSDWANDSGMALPPIAESLFEIKRNSEQAAATIRQNMDTMRGKAELLALGENCLHQIAAARGKAEQDCRLWQAACESKWQKNRQQNEQERSDLLRLIAELRQEVATLSDVKTQPTPTPLATLVSQITTTTTTGTVAPAAVTPVAKRVEAAPVARVVPPAVPAVTASSPAPAVARTAVPAIARPITPAPAPVIDETKLLQSMARAYRRLITMRPMASCIPLPDLYDALHPEFPNLPIAYYKEVLLRLCDQVVLDLVSVNEKREMGRPEFGIPTQAGEFYYVVWR